MQVKGTAPDQAAPRYLVVGCGGIGGVVAAHLLATGHDVTVLCRNDAVRAALLEYGFRVQGATSLHRVAAGPLLAQLPADQAPFDTVLLCTPPPEVEQAAAAVLPFLQDQGRVVCLQNGLCEARVASIVGAQRVLGAVVLWGASTPQPGVYDKTSSGGFVLGALQPQALEGQEPLREALSSVGPVAVTHNLLGARWSKLAINCAISTLGTVAGQPLGSLMLDVRARRLALEIITEVSTVAAAEGIVMERVPGLLDVRWLALKAQPRDGRGAINRATQWISRAIRHAFLLGMGLRYRRLRSSMLAAIERSRPAAVNFLNGEVVQHGDAVGIDAKVNRAAVAAVNDIAAGLKRPSWQELGALYAATR